MSKFLLRMPRCADMEMLRNTLPESELHKFPLPDNKAFHMSDDPNNRFYSGFLPVLEAIGDTATECIRDGTSLYMGDCSILDSMLVRDQKPIHWLKCGRLLLAEDCISDNTTFAYLAQNGFVDGIEVDMPFEQAVTRMFF